jgi:hypothetical protein
MCNEWESNTESDFVCMLGSLHSRIQYIMAKFVVMSFFSREAIHFLGEHALAMT